MTLRSSTAATRPIRDRLHGCTTREKEIVLAVKPPNPVSGRARLRVMFNAIDSNDRAAVVAACRQHIAEAARIAEKILTSDPATV